MIALAPSPAPGNRRAAKYIANQMFVTALRMVAAEHIANDMFATAVKEVRTHTDR